MARIHLGTSGYVYRHWQGIFYPRALKPAQWLEHYARVFSTVELNATFYRLPTEAAVDRWRDESPPGFLFACKGSRYLTHMKRLLDTDRGLTRFLKPVLRLGPKLGPVLWQLPPQMKPDLDRLDHFLGALPVGVRHAVEFRNRDWYSDETCAVLRRHGAAFCEHDLVDADPPRFTARFRYLRFHGATGKYRGRYGHARMAAVAADLKSWRAGRGDAYVYFNNDSYGHAIRDALELSDALGLGMGEAAQPQLRAPAD